MNVAAFALTTMTENYKIKYVVGKKKSLSCFVDGQTHLYLTL